MEVQQITDEHGVTRNHYIAAPGEHVVLTGPITGIMTLEDGTKVNVNDEIVVVASEEQAAELAAKIGQHWAEVGHPDDVDIDEAGEPVQAPFVYVTPEEQAALDEQMEVV